ncbi:MAG: amino acid adenylation domain-containing protein, partial [Vulcanimicrobiaceae bacterium]
MGLSSADIDRIVASVPGGAANVQDIYPLAPLQEGILFHHLLVKEGDPYLSQATYRFQCRERLDAYFVALQKVIDRHDILRTSIVWDGIAEPAQIVWRKAPLVTQEIAFDSLDLDAVKFLAKQFHPQHYRIELSSAPLLRAAFTRDSTGRWVLLLLLHHIAGDHITLDVMQDEIRTILDGREDRLPVPVSFRTFVAQTRLGVKREEHEEFFRQMLADVTEPTAPFGLSSVNGSGLDVLQARSLVDNATSQRLRACARALGVSPASLCHLAWGLVLSRISARQEVVFGTVVFGRAQAVGGSERALGPSINTLPVRVRVGEISLLQSARDIHSLLAKLMRHEHASLALAQRCSGVAAPTPLFTALFNFRNSVAAVESQAAFSNDAIETLGSRERTNYPLTFSVDDLGESFGLTAQVHPSVDPERLCAYMQTALQEMVIGLEGAPQMWAKDVEILPEAEREALFVSRNTNDLPLRVSRCIPDMFEVQVKSRPSNVALTTESRSLSYYELNARANQLARHLRALGVLPDQRVAICSERGADMVIAMLAVLKAGGGYVPLDPSYPIERLQFIIADSKPIVVITDESIADAIRPILQSANVPLVNMSTDAHLWGSEATDDVERPELQPHHLAYVIYTSGSTGKPKGVMVEHRNVVRLFESTQLWFNFNENDVWTFFHSFAFDFSVWEIFGALFYGGRLVIVPRATSRTPEVLYELVCRERVTVFNQTPSSFQQFVAARMSSSLAHHLRYVIFGGEALDVSALRPWFRDLRNTQVRLINMYGITETTVHVTYRALCEGDLSLHISPIGTEIPDLRIYLLDDQRRPVPIGVAGEMYVGGLGVARGYLGQPELTAQRFIADLFVKGERVYRTGDMARYRLDGELEFLGRNDSQVKIRGYRIETGEIEARLTSHPSVQKAVVVAREDVPGEKYLVAYYLGSDDEIATAEKFRAHLLRSLPDYMVPAAFIKLESLPLTANGKIDRLALPSPRDGAYATRTYKAPEGDVECEIARVWCEVLKRERIGRFDDFFLLGGHSLLAVRVVSRLRLRFGEGVDLGKLFARPVLADFACAITESEQIRAGEIPLVDRGKPLDPSFSQQRLWFLSQLGDLSRAYHVPIALRLRGVLNSDALRRALDQIVARHEALRTTFELADLQPIARVQPPFHLNLRNGDLRSHGESHALRALMDEELAEPFNLQTGPLIRGRLVCVAQNEHVLLLTMHHIVSDGWSAGVLFRELSALYAAFAIGEADPLPPLQIQFADYAAWQRDWLCDGVLEEQQTYWKQTLSDAPALIDLPTDRLRPAQQDFAGDILPFVLDKEFSAELLAAAGRNGVTPYILMLTAFGSLLARLTGQNDIV